MALAEKVGEIRPLERRFRLGKRFFFKGVFGALRVEVFFFGGEVVFGRFF